jgi:hypothetical protein
LNFGDGLLAASMAFPATRNNSTRVTQCSGA